MRMVRGSQQRSVVSGESGGNQQRLICSGGGEVSQQRFDPAPPTPSRATCSLFIVLFLNIILWRER